MGISEQIKKLEDIRQKIVIIYTIAAVIALFIVIYFVSNNGILGGNMFIVIAGFITVVALVLTGCGPLMKKFKKEYKEIFLTSVLQDSFDDVIYIWNQGLPKKTVTESGLVQYGNRYSSEDYLSASYKGIHFEQADVDIKNESGGKNKSTTTYFKGRMFSFDFPDKKAVSIQIFSNNFQYRGKPEERWKMKKIELEDIDFNRQFDVKSVDEHEAFYILTPPFMERIKNIKNHFGNLAMHFTHGKLYVGFNSSRDAFDAPIFGKIDYITEKNRMLEDVQVIKDIIDVLIEG